MDLELLNENMQPQISSLKLLKKSIEISRVEKFME